jgi:hypothetical protein
MDKRLLLFFLSFSLMAKEGLITADIGFAEHGNNECTVHAEITNNSSNTFVEAVLIGELLVFDKDAIIVKHGDSFDPTNLITFYVPTRAFKGGATVVADDSISSSFWGSSTKNQCSLISEIQFRLVRGNAKDRMGNNVDLTSFLDTDTKTYLIKDLMPLNW